ncbi:MAG: Holliday junction resolvase RuvX [Pseudomonadota bacterium]|nr:Holliday junction resolvase RuvX [Pseudomonadota bacterium]
MAFDFGSQKMGMAFGQALTGTASPLPLVPMKDGIPNWEHLLKLIQTWQPEACLVGLPLNMDDSESELSRRARKFARRLRHQTNLPVWMVDERLSTRDARERVDQIAQHRRGRLPSADAMAAVLLAETWFREPQGILP